MTRRVALLAGGRSSERTVSLSSARQIGEALSRRGFEVVTIDPQDEEWIEQLRQAKADIAFNALHGPYGEDGKVQGVLEYLGLPYTHSGVLASSLAMNKQRTKEVLNAHGVRSPNGMIVNRFEAAKAHVMDPPYVAKPNEEGSSFGVLIVPVGSNRPPIELASPDWPYGDDVLVEEYCPGRELTVTVLGDRALDVTEIVPKTAFYDFDAKYAEGGSVHELPANIPQSIRDVCMRDALVAHQVLGCQGLTRSDFRYDPETNKVWLLEINTQPGMTPTSLAPEQAAYCGISFDDLVEWMAEDAACES